MALKSVAVVGGELARHDLAAGFLDGLRGLVGQALAVGGAVVDDRDTLGAERAGGVLAQPGALLHVVGDGAEHAAEILQGQLGVGRGRRHLRDARLIVDARGRNRGARVQMPDHAFNPGVHQPLCHRGAGARVGLVVLADELELDLLAADGDALGVGFLDGEAGAVLEILAEVRLVAGQRGGPAQLDDHFLRVGGGEADAHQGDCDDGSLHALDLRGDQGRVLG